MFETSLIDIQKPRRTPKSVLATSAGLHLAIAVAAVSATYWTIGPVKEPIENAVFYLQAALPPPPPASGNRVKPEAAPPKPTAPNHESVQPKPQDVSDTIPKAAEQESPSASQQEVASTANVGTSNMGISGSGNGPDSGWDGPSNGSEASGPGVVSDQPYTLTGAIAKPVIITRVEPLYPESARRARQGGTVILRTVIDESGRVIDVTIVKGLGFGLQQAAIDAVTKWRFSPATMNGRPVKVFFNLTVQFSLS